MAFRFGSKGLWFEVQLVKAPWSSLAWLHDQSVNKEVGPEWRRGADGGNDDPVAGLGHFLTSDGTHRAIGLVRIA